MAPIDCGMATQKPIFDLSGYTLYLIFISIKAPMVTSNGATNINMLNIAPGNITAKGHFRLWIREASNCSNHN